MLKFVARTFHSKRAALDIGSGSIKCSIAVINNGKITERLYNSSENVLFMNDFFAKGIIGNEIIQKGEQTI
jgi:exopolyphosphatase/pppGpp-phosphohydrolase